MKRKLLAAALFAAVSSIVVPSMLLAQSAASPKSTPGTYKVDAIHSAAVFSVQHANAGTSWGRVNDPAGTLTVGEDGNLQSVEVLLDVTKIDTANAKRDDHLRSPDYFNAKQYPEMSFKSTKVEPGTDGSFQVTGDLTIKATTQQITVTITKVGEFEAPQLGHRVGFDTSFTVDRLAFGVGAPPMLGKDVKVNISIEAVKQ